MAVILDADTPRLAMGGCEVKPKLPVPLEKDIQAAIIEYAWLQFRLKLYRRNTGAVKASYKGKPRFIRFSEPGQADLWGIQPKTGRHVEVEVKRPGNTPTEAQMEWLAQCRELNGIAFWADSIEEFDCLYRMTL